MELSVDSAKIINKVEKTIKNRARPIVNWTGPIWELEAILNRWLLKVLSPACRLL